VGPAALLVEGVGRDDLVGEALVVVLKHLLRCLTLKLKQILHLELVLLGPAEAKALTLLLAEQVEDLLLVDLQERTEYLHMVHALLLLGLLEYVLDESGDDALLMGLADDGLQLGGAFALLLGVVVPFHSVSLPGASLSVRKYCGVVSLDTILLSIFLTSTTYWESWLSLSWS